MSKRTGASGLVARALDKISRRMFEPHVEHHRRLRLELEELRTIAQRLDRRLDDLATSRKHISGLLKARDDEVVALRERLDRVVANQKEEQRFRAALLRQMSSVIRAGYLHADIPAPFWLLARRFRLRSQHEEDGIILALLQETGVGSRRFVEIGSGSTGGNSAVLAHDMGWSGLMIDANTRSVHRLREETRANAAVAVVEAKVTSTNVNSILDEHGVTGEIDLLSIDVDSIDYWVFEAIEACTARVVVLEYNAHFGPTRAVTLPNADPPAGAPKLYFGASLAALAKVARRKGYRLVLCEDAGVNAFFVRDGLAPAIHGLAPEQAYRPFRHRVRDDGEHMDPDEVFRLLEESGLPLVEV